MSSEIIMIVGCPAAGKSSLSKKYTDQGYVYLNRDSAGGKVVSLVPKMETAIRNDKSVVLDNLFATIESRQPFIQTAQKMRIPIKCVHLTTSIEDGQINALRRMHQRYGQFFMNAEELKDVNKKDPNMFPPLVLFKYRKEFQKPSLAEGFTDIETVKFVREWSAEYKNKALILDYDSNLRESTHATLDYPVHPSQVVALPGRKEKIQEYVDLGYVLCGISNQSGVHKGLLTLQDCIDCFEKTNELIGHKIDYTFCPHQSNPPSCFCRKPQSGLFVKLIERYKLDVKQSLFVGDQTTDKTGAERLGIPFMWTHEFFK